MIALTKIGRYDGSNNYFIYLVQPTWLSEFQCYYGFQTYKTSMNSEITNGDDFYDCLYRIEEIRTEQVNVEMFFRDLNHRIYVLEKAGVAMPREDLTYVSYIQDDWTMLQQIASGKKLFLEKAKTIWSHTVKLNIETFANDVNAFLDNYRRRGSKKIEDDLDAGLALMDVRTAKPLR